MAEVRSFALPEGDAASFLNVTNYRADEDELALANLTEMVALGKEADDDGGGLESFSESRWDDLDSITHLRWVEGG